MWPGFDSQTQRHMWVEFVGSLLCSDRFFSEYSSFPLSTKKKTTIFALILFALILSVFPISALVLNPFTLK